MAQNFGETNKNTSEMPLVEGKDGFEVGQMLGGKYKLLATLGSGGMGTVYKVQQVFLNKEFALKTMDIRTVSNVTLQRFQLEAKAASSLNHPNLVHVHDFGLLEDDQPYLVMDLVNGITFAQYLKEHGPLPVKDVAAFFAPACFGLLAVHEMGLVHRDIKPGNIMVVTSLPLGSEQSIKVVDFGIAKQTSRESGEIQALTATGEIFGSPLYMSPEQCTGGAVDHRSDIYSLGCVLFEMLTGTPPYFGQSALSTMMLHESGKPPTLKEASLGSEFPEALEQVVAKMLRKSPAERYQNIGLVAHDLAAVCKGGVIDAPRTRTHESASAKKQSKTITIGAVKLYAILAAVALIPSTLAWIGGYHFRQREETKKEPAEKTEPTSASTSDSNSEFMIGPGTTRNEELKNLAAKSRVIEASGPISASLVERNGVKKRMYVFPSCGIGLLCAYNSKTPTETPDLTWAKGITYAPAEGDLALRLTDIASIPAIQTPSIFSKIRGKEFRALFLSDASRENFGLGDVGEKPADDIAAVLANVKNWTGLETLKLKDLTLNTSAYNAMNQLKTFRNLVLDNCGFEATEMVAQPFLTRLEFVNLTKMEPGNLNILLQKLATSPKLRDFTLIVTPGIPSVSVFEQLRTCPNLRHLRIRFKNSQPQDRFIEAVCQLNQIEHLSLQEGELSEVQIKRLSKCPWFTEIILSRDKHTPSVQKQFQKIDQRIGFG